MIITEERLEAELPIESVPLRRLATGDVVKHDGRWKKIVSCTADPMSTTIGIYYQIKFDDGPHYNTFNGDTLFQRRS